MREGNERGRKKGERGGWGEGGWRQRKRRERGGEG